MVRRSGKGDGWEQVERVESRVVTIQNWDNYQLELELELVSSIVQAILFQLSILYSIYSCPDYIYISSTANRQFWPQFATDTDHS